jgi:predicted RNA binding protein YcfA (HicA-like mRNA interferase family)
MKLPRDINAAQIIKALGRLGYFESRQTGSHIRLQCVEPPHSITIPNHRPIKIGTLSAILTDVAAIQGLSRDDLLAKLFD